MFDPLWESVYRLERLGMRVLGVCCDGLAANRRLFSLHCSGSNALIYKVLNPHANERRYLFFFSDPPHTVRKKQSETAGLTAREIFGYI